MTFDDLVQLFEEHPGYGNLEFSGKCEDCGENVTIIASLTEDGMKIHISHADGAVLKVKSTYSSSSYSDSYRFKCNKCYKNDPVFHTFCEVYSRIVGYLRPLNQWNNGKQAEFKMRKTFEHSFSKSVDSERKVDQRAA